MTSPWNDHVFRFASPWWLAALAVWAVGLLVRSLGARRARSTIAFSAADLLVGLTPSWPQRLRPLLETLAQAGVAFLIVGLAKPQFGLESLKNTTQGVGIMMCLDKSGSMKAEDFALEGRRVSRIEAVKHVFREFVGGQSGEGDGRPSDLIGLVAFGGYPECLCPLTLDHKLLIDILDQIQIPTMVLDRVGRARGDRSLEYELATAIGDGLALSCERLKSAKVASKVIILLTDGDNTAGVISPDKALQVAKEMGVKIYSVVVGSASGMIQVPFEDLSGRTFYQSQRVRVDDRLPRRLAEETGGQFFYAEDTETLQKVYAEIDRLEKSEVEGSTIVHYRDIFGWPVAVGLGLLAASLPLLTTRLAPS